MTTGELKNKFPSMNISMPFDAFLGRIEEKLKGESTASNLGRHLGVPMAESHFVSVNETPFVSILFYPGIKDRAFGDKLDYTEDKNQDFALASGAIFKLILDARQDDGQYLQRPDEGTLLSDIRVDPYMAG